MDVPVEALVFRTNTPGRWVLWGFWFLFKAIPNTWLYFGFPLKQPQRVGSAFVFLKQPQTFGVAVGFHLDNLLCGFFLGT